MQSGQTRAVLVLEPGGSGTLTATSLAPEDSRPQGDSLGDPLNIALSITCAWARQVTPAQRGLVGYHPPWWRSG